MSDLIDAKSHLGEPEFDDETARRHPKPCATASHTLQSLEPGTWAMAKGPYGAVMARWQTRRNVLLVVGGVSITPMWALFETMPLAPGRSCCCFTGPVRPRR